MATNPLDIRPHYSYLPNHLAHPKGTCPAGMPKRRSEGRCPRAELPIRTRAALGHRSTGKRTGLQGACLTEG